MTITVPQTLREPCATAKGADAVKTVSDLAGYSLRQEGALMACDAKRSALVDLIDEHKRVVTPKRKWWRFGAG